jgi:hypothetical protein
MLCTSAAPFKEHVMFRPRHSPTAKDTRRGIILLVVLALLTLFAIVGISFVLYANAEADASRIYREAQGIIDRRPDISANLLLNWALSQSIYDVDDSPTATNPALGSAMRGHSLARDMYGWNSDNTASNIYPFNGTGRLHATGISSPAYDEYNLLNYAYYCLINKTTTPHTYTPVDNFIRDPERLGNRIGTNANRNVLQPYTGGWNSPYTFPDLNHCYLAAIDSNGNILTPSFARGWVPSASGGFGPMDPTNPNWTTPSVPNTPSAMLKYLVLRPRPADMDPTFPLPQKDALGNVGDVQNAVGLTKGLDSFWMDLDYPVQVAADGTKFKPLFAFLIMDLDSRINLNLAGNIRGAGNNHVSNRGYGPWEINPRLLPNAGPATEWPQLYTGNASATPPAIGRYGPDQQPGVAGSSATLDILTPHDYAQTDVDALDPASGNATGQYTLPLPAGTCFPPFPSGYDNGSAPELMNHPAVYNLFSLAGGDRRFPLSDMQLLLNNGTSGTLWKSSSFGQLCPNLFNNTRLRNLVTTDSYDVNRPGLSPWFLDRTTSGYGPNPNANADPYGPPFGAPVALPQLAQRAGAVPNYSDFRLPGQSGNTGANAVDWRWNAVDTLGNALTKIDLNRFLPPYPHMGKWTQWPTPPSLTSPNGYVFYNGNANTAEVPVGTPYSGDPNAVTQFGVAQQARQNMAADIYRCFLAVTGLPPVANPAAPTPPEIGPRRWLAQLAVNIVDYIDEDDISTPFNFGQLENIQEPTPGPSTTFSGDLVPTTWVFGTELPRVVLNEVYAEYQNPTMGTGPYLPKTSGNPNVRVWAELHNPLPTTTPASAQQLDSNANPVPLYMGTSPGGYQAYQVVIASTNAATNSRGLWLPTTTPSTLQNVLGTPDATAGGGIRKQTSTTANPGTDFTQTYTINGTTLTTAASNPPPTLKPPDVLVLGPNTPPDTPDTGNMLTNGPDVENTINVKVAGTTPNGQLPMGTKAVLTPNMEFQVNSTYNAANTPPYSWVPDDRPNGLTVLLRRLANPYIVAQSDPTQPNYNPYITVDFMDHVSMNDYTPRSTTPYFPAPGTTTWPPGSTNPYPSRGKQQPYAADSSQIANMADPTGVTATTPTVHNLGVVPNVPTGIYDWLVHLDRPLISPAELLQVSAYPPSMLTHQFITASGKFMHRAPWFDEPALGVPATGTTPNSARIYRALEFLDVHSRASGVGLSGRVPGQVNINTIWDPEVFYALCDAQAGNYFTGSPGDVSTMWGAIVGSRTPDTAQINPLPAPVTNVPGLNSRPFLGMAAPNTPGGDPWFQGAAYSATTPAGINDTLLRTPTGGTTPLLQLTNAGRPHPYQQDELLTKILNNVTTRSNVFAVWVTVGFFPVVQDTDPTTGRTLQPVKLGAEIGLGTGQNIRHRLFAIVDRSTLAIDQQVTTLSAAVTPTNPPGPVTVNVAATSGTTSNTHINWSITPGTVLLVGTGANMEAVLVTAVNGNQVTATFQQGHAANTPVTIPGNPGPQPGFSVNGPQYAGVVPYFAIMQ